MSRPFNEMETESDVLNLFQSLLLQSLDTRGVNLHKAHDLVTIIKSTI